MDSAEPRRRSPVAESRPSAPSRFDQAGVADRRRPHVDAARRRPEVHLDAEHVDAGERCSRRHPIPQQRRELGRERLGPREDARAQTACSRQRQHDTARLAHEQVARRRDPTRPGRARRRRRGAPPRPRRGRARPSRRAGRRAPAAARARASAVCSSRSAATYEKPVPTSARASGGGGPMPQRRAVERCNRRPAPRLNVSPRERVVDDRRRACSPRVAAGDRHGPLRECRRGS